MQENSTTPESGTPLLNKLQEILVSWGDKLLQWAVSPDFYLQIVSIAGAVGLGFFLAKFLRTKVPFFVNAPTEGKFFKLRNLLYDARHILFRLSAVLLLGIAARVIMSSGSQDWLVRITQGLMVIWLIYAIIDHFVPSDLIKRLIRWIGIPIAVLSVLGLLDDASQFLDTLSLELGSIRLSLLTIARLAIFGTVLFWVGRLSNTEGKKVIRQQEHLDVGTREVFAKLFEIVLFSIIFILLLQIAGINLTALAVFGGALGVGLGFGLQQIAANFISGIIILLDRSLTIGDYIELEDGKTGFLTDLTMRSATLETPDGKDIVVPNEQFITTAFTNWTHKDPRQRYEVEFMVSYDTDLDHVIALLIPALEAHEQVLSDPEEPDVEVREFAEYGILMGAEFWVDGIDEGENKFTSDIMLLIWRTLKQHNIKMPVAQRMVTVSGTVQ